MPDRNDPLQWSAEFRRWLMARYFRRNFLAPYQNTGDAARAAWHHLLRATMRSQQHKTRDGIVSVSSSADTDECFAIAHKLFVEESSG